MSTMSNNRHDKLNAARRLLSRGTSASPSVSPDCIFFENDESFKSPRNTQFFTAPCHPNSLAARCHPVLADLPAPPLWKPDDPQNATFGSRQRVKQVNTTEQTQVLCKLPPPRRQSNHRIDELVPFQDIAVPFPHRRSSWTSDATYSHRRPSYTSAITTDATYSHRGSFTSDISCNEKHLPSHCDKNGHCIEHVGIRLYKKHPAGVFSKMLDFCPLCMIKKTSCKSEKLKPITPKTRYPSYDEGWENPADCCIPVQAEKSRSTSSKERSKKSGSIRSGKSRSSSSDKSRSLSRNKPRSLSRDKYSLVKASSTNGQRRDKNHSSTPSHGYIIDDRNHLLDKTKTFPFSHRGHCGEMATKSTCSSSYLSEEIGNDFMSNFDHYVVEYERQIEIKRKQRTGTSLRQHSKQKSSSRDYAHEHKSRKNRTVTPSHDPNLEFDKDGCCKNHPSQILAVKKSFVKEWCIVQDACPLCINEASMDLIVQRRSYSSSIPSLFGN